MATGATPNISTFNARVVNIIDGDTIDVLEKRDDNTDNLDETIRVRLLGINTPDRKLRATGYEICKIEYSDIERDCFDVTEARYIEARSFLQDNLLNNEVRITYDKGNPFGTHDRLLALVNINNSEVNKSLLSNGLATVFFYAPNALFDTIKKGDYILAEAEARNKGIGVWAERGGIPVKPKVEATVLLHPEQTHENLFIGIEKRHKFKVLNYGTITASFQICERFESVEVEHIEEFKSNELTIDTGSEAELEVAVTLSPEAIPIGKQTSNYTIWTRLFARPVDRTLYSFNTLSSIRQGKRIE